MLARLAVGEILSCHGRKCLPARRGTLRLSVRQNGEFHETVTAVAVAVAAVNLSEEPRHEF